MWKRFGKHAVWNSVLNICCKNCYLMLFTVNSRPGFVIRFDLGQAWHVPKACQSLGSCHLSYAKRIEWNWPNAPLLQQLILFACKLQVSQGGCSMLPPIRCDSETVRRKLLHFELSCIATHNASLWGAEWPAARKLSKDQLWCFEHSDDINTQGSHHNESLSPDSYYT